MAKKRSITATGYVNRGGKPVRRESLPRQERMLLADRLNRAAMEEAGYAPKKRDK